MDNVFVLTIQEPDCQVCTKVFSTQKSAIAYAVRDSEEHFADDDLLEKISEDLVIHGYAMGVDDVFYQIDECQIIH